MMIYCVQPEKSWEVDLDQMESLMDDDTAAILINNPSNPCGSVFSVKHIREILAVAEKNKVPVIADEIYAHFVSTLRQRRGNETNIGGADSHDDGLH